MWSYVSGILSLGNISLPILWQTHPDSTVHPECSTNEKVTGSLRVCVQHITFLPIKPNSFFYICGELLQNRKQATYKTREKSLRNVFWL
jgi:hypothetical protein